MHPQDQNGHQVESIGPEEEGPIPQWAPSPPGPPPSCLRSRPCSSTGLAPPLPPHNPEKESRWEKWKITDRSKPSQCCRFQWCWTLWGGREQRAPGCVTPDSSHPGEKGWWRNFLRDFFFCIQHLLETWQEVVTLQGPKPPPNINTGKWYTWALDDGKNISVKDNGPNWVGYLA